MAKRASTSHRNGVERVLVFSDIQYPLHDPRSLGAVESFIPDFDPSLVIYIGDGLQMDCVSHWLADKRRPMEGQRVLKDYAGFSTNVLDKHESLAPNAKRVYLLGNHEDWARQYVDLHPEVEGLLEVEVGLRLRERRYTVVPFGETIAVGHLNFVHGMYTNEHHTKAMVQAFRRNIRYGHTHDIQYYTSVSPMDVQDRISGASIGCLCNVNPTYLKNRPNRWQHGFMYAYVRPDGTFTDHIVPIIDGRFTLNGKTYRG